MTEKNNTKKMDKIGDVYTPINAVLVVDATPEEKKNVQVYNKEKKRKPYTKEYISGGIEVKFGKIVSICNLNDKESMTEGTIITYVSTNDELKMSYTNSEKSINACYRVELKNIIGIIK